MRRLSVLVFLVVVAAVQAELKLPRIFGSHMVVQRGKPVAVWGTADAGAAVTVAFAGNDAKATAGADGAWSVQLPAMDAGGPHVMTIAAGADTVTFDDVLVGEVWICSGQSNMQFGLRSSTAGEAACALPRIPKLRLFQIHPAPELNPLPDLKTGAWFFNDSEDVLGFTAVGFYFGRELEAALGVPVGLIQTAVGGTIAEAWTRQEALADLAAKEQVPAVARRLAERQELSGDLDKLNVGYQEKLKAYRESVAKLYELEADDTPAKTLAAPDLDDGDWPTMKLPGNWEQRGLPGLDGIVWFRLTVDVPAELAGKDAVLNLGPIDEVDQTWFNGQRVGGKGNMKTNHTEFWNVARHYPVPANLLKAGRNVVTCRVFDMAGQGGLWGGAADEMYLGAADGTGPRVPLAGDWRYQVALKVLGRPRPPLHSNVASALWNGMVAPFAPYTVAGAIWYQGESNAGNPEEYEALLSTMIRDWRQQFRVPDMAFGIVQLANFRTYQTDPGEAPGWAALRAAQTATAEHLPNVGQAVIIDIGDAKDIHPRNKTDVGKRLALWAQAKVYGRDVVYSGPVFTKMTVEGAAVRLAFDHVGGGLVLRDTTPSGWALQGADGAWHWATATVDGQTIVVSSPDVPEPRAVRYGWANNPPAPLYNAAGLPAVPFATDGGR